MAEHSQGRIFAIDRYRATDEDEAAFVQAKRRRAIESLGESLAITPSIDCSRVMAPAVRPCHRRHFAVWCWDMIYLPATVAGRWFHLYLILDLYSRKIVGGEVHDSDDSHHAAHLVKRTALAEGIAALETKPVLHGDKGSTLKATTVLTMLWHWASRPVGHRHPWISV